LSSSTTFSIKRNNDKNLYRNKETNNSNSKKKMMSMNEKSNKLKNWKLRRNRLSK